MFISLCLDKQSAVILLIFQKKENIIGLTKEVILTIEELIENAVIR